MASVRHGALRNARDRTIRSGDARQTVIIHGPPPKLKPIHPKAAAADRVTPHASTAWCTV